MEVMARVSEEIFLVVGFHKDETKVFSVHRTKAGAVAKLERVKANTRNVMFQQNMTIWTYQLEE